MTESNYRWYRELDRYQWFVLIVAALGWLFDTMDQQVFLLARVDAMRELLGGVVPPAEAAFDGQALAGSCRRRVPCIAGRLAALRFRRRRRLGRMLHSWRCEIEAVLRVATCGLCPSFGVVACARIGGTFRTASSAATAPTSTSSATLATLAAITTIRSLVAPGLGRLRRCCFRIRRC